MLPLASVSLIGLADVPRCLWAGYAPYTLGRLESVWGADAGEFRPERWLEMAESSGHSTLSSSFSRICLRGLRLCVLAARWAHASSCPPAGKSVRACVSAFKFISFNAGPRLCLGACFWLDRDRLYCLTRFDASVRSAPVRASALPRRSSLAPAPPDPVPLHAGKDMAFFEAKVLACILLPRFKLQASRTIFSCVHVSCTVLERRRARHAIGPFDGVRSALTDCVSGLLVRCAACGGLRAAVPHEHPAGHEERAAGHRHAAFRCFVALI